MPNHRRCHQMTGIYRTSDNIENLKIRVTFKTIISFLKIPPFHATAVDSASEACIDDTEVVELRWQEKRLSFKEVQAYQFKENCKTDLEKKYHQLVRSRRLGASEKPTGKLFTYTTEDKFDIGLEVGGGEAGEVEQQSTSPKEASSETSSQNGNAWIPDSPLPFGASLSDTSQGFETYFIMVELNVEIVLIKIAWRKADGLLVIYPDFNGIDHAPYVLEVDADTKQMYHFAVENVSTRLTRARAPQTLLDPKLPTDIKRDLLRLPSDTDYNKAHLLLQIVNAKGFEYDNVHIRFAVKIPPTTEPMDSGALFGSTHSSYKGSNGVWNFGFCHEVSLQSFDHFRMDDFIDIDFKVISIDDWKRERIEGLSTLRVPVKPGWELRDELGCYRITAGTLIERLERFFIGDRNYQEDFSVKRTMHQEGVNRYGVRTISTGQIGVIVYLILQSRSGKIMSKALE